MKTILLIDDDDEMRQTYGLLLRQNGYDVLEANSGPAGLEMARRHLPDLILSDIHMPGGDGTTLLRDLRADPELKFIQIVLMTGQPELVSPRRVMEDGADDFLVKPVSMRALLASLKARLNRASVSWRVEDQVLDKLRSAVPVNLPHEFFTPMAGIIGLSEILLEGVTKITAEEIGDIAQDIHQSALRLNRTLRNYLLILELKTSEPDVSLPPLSPIRIEESVHAGVKEALRFHSRRDDIKISVAATPLAIKGEDLTRMIEELVDNACKFSRKGTLIQVNFEKGKLTVSDQGRGMTPEQIGQIGAFKQFERTRYEQQGLGLGLLLVQRLVELYKTRLDFASEPGKGTKVEISFPTV